MPDVDPVTVPPDETVRYATEVVAVGELVADFAGQGVLIIFGEMAPEELHEFVVLHRPTVALAAPLAGDVVELAGEAFTVTAVGDVVAQNLLQLGHLSFKTDGATTAPLPGDVCLEPRPLPVPVPGARVRILAGPARQPSSTPTTASQEAP